jgi:ABC-type multidrug transport system ATPase subunit
MPTPITLSWHELSYDVILPVIKRSRTILNCISGWGEPNDMVAFIGGQAAGKTTLLNCLAGIIFIILLIVQYLESVCMEHTSKI